MKKIILTAILLMAFTLSNVYSQDQPKPGKSFVYCELVGSGQLLSTKVTVYVDFGQATKLFQFNDSRLKDADGKPIKFNSMVDAMNYMGKDGWQFVQAYVVTDVNTKNNIYHWLLKKEMDNTAIQEVTTEK